MCRTLNQGNELKKMLEIKKLDYSVNPWRLIQDGNIIETPKSFTDDSGNTHHIWGSVSGNTKSECIQKCLDMLEILIEREDKRNREKTIPGTEKNQLKLFQEKPHISHHSINHSYKKTVS